MYSDSKAWEIFRKDKQSNKKTTTKVLLYEELMLLTRRICINIETIFIKMTIRKHFLLRREEKNRAHFNVGFSKQDESHWPSRT